MRERSGNEGDTWNGNCERLMMAFMLWPRRLSICQKHKKSWKIILPAAEQVEEKELPVLQKIDFSLYSWLDFSPSFWKMFELWTLNSSLNIVYFRTRLLTSLASEVPPVVKIGVLFSKKRVQCLKSKEGLFLQLMFHFHALWMAVKRIQTTPPTQVAFCISKW